MKKIVLCAVAALTLCVGLWPQSAQQTDPKAEIKIKRRDVRYGGGKEKLSTWPDGMGQESFIHFVTPDDEIADTPEKKIAAQKRLGPEQAAKRRAVACDSTVILFGKIVNGKGFVTSDDSNTYTVYKFAVNDVFRAPPFFKLEIGDQIEVTMRGGAAKTKAGTTVNILDPIYDTFTLNKDFILYLKYDQEADDYYVFDPVGVYQIAGERLVRADLKHGYHSNRARLAQEPTTFDEVVREVKSVTCQK